MGGLLSAILSVLTMFSYVQGPCTAVHYGRVGYRYETSMPQVVANRLKCPNGPECIEGFHKRADVTDFIAIRYADRWRIAQNYRALVVFKLPKGGYSSPTWLQPVDYQAKRDVRSSGCRVETSEKLAARMGWSYYANDEGRTTAYIVRWEK